MVYSIVSVLAERPEAELQQMRSKLEAEQSRLDEERTRVGFEMAQVDEALGRRARKGARSAHSRAVPPPVRPGSTQKRVLDAVAGAVDSISPAGIIAEMHTSGSPPSRGSVHNAIARLLKKGQLVKVDDGLYQLGSRNSILPDALAGPSENGASQPLSPAGQPQEGA